MNAVCALSYTIHIQIHYRIEYTMQQQQQPKQHTQTHSQAVVYHTVTQSTSHPNEPTSSIIEIWFNSHLNNFSSLPISQSYLFSFSSGFCGFDFFFFLSFPFFYGSALFALLVVCVFRRFSHWKNIFLCLLFFSSVLLFDARMMLSSLSSIHFKSV